MRGGNGKGGTICLACAANRAGRRSVAKRPWETLVQELMKFGRFLIDKFFPSKPPHVRIAILLITIGGMTLAGPPLWLFLAGKMCTEFEETTERLCAAPEAPLWVGLVIIASGIATYFLGERFNPTIKKDDWISIGCDGLTFVQVCAQVERSKNVRVRLTGLTSEEQNRPLAKCSASGKTVEDFLKDLLGKVKGDVFPNCRVWTLGNQYYVGREKQDADS